LAVAVILKEYLSGGSMPDNTEHVTEANCVLCRDLDLTQRSAMRADLIVISLREIEHICDGCMEAFTASLFASFPKTEEKKLRRREEMARAANE
jgi:hypothetical protein